MAERQIVFPRRMAWVPRRSWDARLHRFEWAKAFFVIHAKKSLDFAVRESRPVDKATGLRCDQSLTPRGVKSTKSRPDRLRRIRYTDPDTGQRGHKVQIRNSMGVTQAIGLTGDGLLIGVHDPRAINSAAAGYDKTTE